MPAPEIPVPPAMKSPVDFFRELLAMTPSQRAQALTNRPPETRKLILAKVREYLSLNADELELRLKATELEWRLVPLMKASPTNRAPQLAALSEDDRKMIEARLKEWDQLPESVKTNLLDRRESIRLYIQMKSGTATSTNIYIPLRPKVQEDLKLTTDQKEKVDKIAKELAGKHAAESSGIGLLLNVYTNRVTIGTQSDLITRIVQKLWRNPSLLPEFMALHHGSYKPVDVIEVDGKPIIDVKTFRDALNKADPKRGVLLYLDRKGSKTFAVLKAGD